MFVPADALAGPLLLTKRSASAPADTSVPAKYWLLLVFGSGRSDEAVTLLMMVVPPAAGCTVTSMLNVALVPAAREAIEQVTVPPVVQANVGPLVCRIEEKVTLLGRVSTNLAFGASCGPRLPIVT